MRRRIRIATFMQLYDKKRWKAYDLLKKKIIRGYKDDKNTDLDFEDCEAWADTQPPWQPGGPGPSRKKRGPAAPDGGASAQTLAASEEPSDDD